LVLLAPLVRPNPRMKAGLRKIVFEVCIRVTVIMPGRGGLEKLSCEQTSVAKTKIQSSIQPVLSSQIEFVADVPARTGTGGNSNRSTAGIEIVI